MKDASASARLKGRRFGWALAAALLLVGCLPAGAQTFFLPAQPVTSSTPIFSARLVSPPVPAAPSYSERLETSVRADYRSHNLNPIVESATDYVETPFVQQTRVSVARFGGGRFELGGFDALRPTENFVFGPPASGNLPASSLGLQVHPAILVPLADESYGLSLSIHLQRDLQPERPVMFWRCLGRVVGAGRGCHLN